MSEVPLYTRGVIPLIYCFRANLLFITFAPTYYLSRSSQLTSSQLPRLLPSDHVLAASLAVPALFWASYHEETTQGTWTECGSNISGVASGSCIRRPGFVPRKPRVRQQWDTRHIRPIL